MEPRNVLCPSRLADRASIVEAQDFQKITTDTSVFIRIV